MDMSRSPKIVRRKGQSTSSSSSQRYMLLLVKVLLIVLILLWLAPLVSSKKRRKRKKRQTLKSESHKSRLDCEMECLDLIPEEAMNCIFQCWSPVCFQQIYGEDPLEPGQVDMERGKKMDECVQEELRTQRIEERARKRNATTTIAEAEAIEATQLEEASAGFVFRNHRIPSHV